MDVKKLIVEKLKAKGIDLAEEVARDVVVAVFEVAEEITKATPNALDDAVFGIVKGFEGKILSAIDKLDGKEG